MAKVPVNLAVSDLRQDTARVLKDLSESNDLDFITQRGHTTAVLMSLDAYRHAEALREILLLLARGAKEIQAGAGHSLDSMLEEASSLLRGG
jgi:PHD/YefM family antitoxin component YafN of YafNO toxin-antitoxin module